MPFKEKRMVSVIGHFGFGKNLSNGQTIKTKIVTEALEDKIGIDCLKKVDTHGGIKAYIKLPFQILSALIDSLNIIIFPAHNGVRAIVPLLVLLNKVYKRRLHYVVIGGWLPKLCLERPGLARRLNKLDYIYVETDTMRQALEEQGFKNIVIMPNFKNLITLKEEELIFQNAEPYKLCTFSRIMKEKGIEDAVAAVKTINEERGHTVFELDIYGQIDSNQGNWFDDLKREFPDYISYKGLVPFDKSVDVLKGYFALLFPTRFYTEGIPGTILDAYAAGIPVIASRWESFDDLIENNSTGIGYRFANIRDLIGVLNECANDSTVINSMKKKCLNKAEEFRQEKVIEIIVKRLNKKCME